MSSHSIPEQKPVLSQASIAMPDPGTPSERRYQEGYVNGCRKTRDELAAMSEWQPVEMAPKDGTKFLIVRDDGEYELCEWCEHLPLYSYVHVEGDLYRRVQDEAGPGFWNGNMQCAVGWMPLPEPPTKSE